MKKNQLPFRQFLNLLIVALFAAVSVSMINAQTSGVDSSFNTTPAKTANALNDFEIQPDGKILTFAFAGTRIFNGVPRNQIARLNTDGSLDTSFSCPACDFNISSVRLQPDGKIIVAGASSGSSSGSSSVARIRRLNSDGSIDYSLTSPFGAEIPTVYSSAIVEAIQPDGKILVLQSYSNNGIQVSIIRLNTDGSYDSSFTTIAFNPGRTTAQLVSQVKLQADGKILAAGGNGGFQSFGFLYRFNSDGTRDMTFESPTLATTFGTASTTVNDFDIQPDGSIVFVGRFDTVNSINRVAFAKLLPAGNVDLSFPQTNFFDAGYTISEIKVLSNGKFYVIGGQPFFSGKRLWRFNADGTIDNNFNFTNSYYDISKFVVDTQGRVLINVSLSDGVYQTLRLNSDGSLDNTFNFSAATVGAVSALTSQSDGKIIIAGDFNLVNNVSRSNLARVNADGSLDASFNPAGGFDLVPKTIVVQSDGKILIGGNFTTFNGAARFGIVRLNADGSLDNGFAAVLSDNASAYAIALRSDGKIYIGGFFTNVNGQSRNSLALLNADGTLDATFNPTFSSSTVNSIVVQSDGKVLVGGSFSGVNGFNRSNLARLNADGSLDATFNAGNIGAVKEVEIQANGKYVVLTNTLRRLNNDGTADSTFQSPTFTFTGNLLTAGFVLPADGSIIIAAIS